MSDNPEATLAEGEPHPAAHSAYVWFHEQVIADPIGWVQIKEAITSTALSGNRLAEICYSTIKRLEEGKSISDRYLLGLAWFIRDMRDSEKPRRKKKVPTTFTNRKKSGGKK